MPTDSTTCKSRTFRTAKFRICATKKQYLSASARKTEAAGGQTLFHGGQEVGQQAGRQPRSQVTCNKNEGLVAFVVQPVVDLRGGWCPRLPLQVQTFNHRPPSLRRPPDTRFRNVKARCQPKNAKCGKMQIAKNRRRWHVGIICVIVVLASMPEQHQPAAVFAEKRLGPPHEVVPMCFAAINLGHFQDRGRTDPRRDC